MSVTPHSRLPGEPVAAKARRALWLTICDAVAGRRRKATESLPLRSGAPLVMDLRAQSVMGVDGVSPVAGTDNNGLEG